MTQNEIENHVEEMILLFGDKIILLATHYPQQFAYYWNLYQFYRNRSAGKELTQNE